MANTSRDEIEGPIKQRAYNCPPNDQEFIKKEIEAMESKGIIRESYDPGLFQ